MKQTEQRRKFLGIQWSKFNEKGERQPWWRLPEKWHKYLEFQQMFKGERPPYKKWRFIYTASLGLLHFNLIFLAFNLLGLGAEAYQNVTIPYAIFLSSRVCWEAFQHYYGENRINAHGVYTHTMDFDFRDILVAMLFPTIQLILLANNFTIFA